MIYTLNDFNCQVTESIERKLAEDCRKRRLEKGWSRASLSKVCGVPAPTIAVFEKEARISLLSFIKIAVALGYKDEILNIMSHSKYSTIEEVKLITKNMKRLRGR